MALAVSARRMLRRNVLVRNLESIVDLSAVCSWCLCSLAFIVLVLVHSTLL